MKVSERYLWKQSIEQNLETPFDLLEPHERQTPTPLPCLRTPLLLNDAAQDDEQNFGFLVSSPHFLQVFIFEPIVYIHTLQ